MNEDRTHTTTRVGLDIGRDRNRELLANQFTDHDVFEFSGTVPSGTDLCVVDEVTINQSAGRFATWHERQAPVFAPVALLSETSSADPWQRLEGSMTGYVDAILQIPMSKSELEARIDNLLQRRHVSRALAEEQQLTRSIFDSSPLAKSVLRPDGTVVRSNERAVELFGADGVDVSAIDLPLARVLEAGESVHGYEHRVSFADRDDVWISVNMAPIRNESGQIKYVVAVLEDVTVRRAQAAKLEQQVDLFRKAQDIAHVGAWEFDIESGTLYWTDEVYRIYGLSSEITPTPDLALEAYHPEDRASVRKAIERAVERDERYDLERRLVTDSGDVRWVRTRGEPQSVDGEVTRIRGAIQDVTDRKERAMELQQMTDAVDRAPIGIVLSDPTRADNPLIYVNDGFVEQTGYTRDEALGRNCRFLQGDDTDEEAVARLRRAIDAEEPISVTIRNYRADGSSYWNRLEIAPVRDDDGTVVNFIGFQQDVTDIIERQRQLQMLDRYLRHNVRNKMNVVYGLAELIHEEAEPPITEYAETIERTSDTLLGNMEKERAITKLLRSEAAATTTELKTLLERVVTELDRQHPAATVSVSGPSSVHVQAIPELPTAFTELVRNAIDHNDGPEPNVELRVEPGEDVVRVDVVDDGPGIPEMEVEVLTDADAETAVKHGQGLGLWMVYLIVRRSGGRVEFEERPAGGSLVTVELPVPDDGI